MKGRTSHAALCAADRDLTHEASGTLMRLQDAPREPDAGSERRDLRKPDRVDAQREAPAVDHGRTMVRPPAAQRAPNKLRQSGFRIAAISLPVRGSPAGRAEWFAPHARAATENEQASMTPPRILIVEDFIDSREMYMEFLLAHGFEVLGAEDGLAALRSIEEHPPDVVVLDIALPKLDGLSVLRKLRQDPRFAALPVLTLSASLGADYQRVALGAGATAASEKPCLPEELLEAVRRVLPAR